MKPEPARRGPSLADRASKAAELELAKYQREKCPSKNLKRIGENYWGYHCLYSQTKAQDI